MNPYQAHPILLPLLLLPSTLQAVHPCNANAKLDGVALDSNCLKAGVARTTSGPISTSVNGQVIENKTIDGNNTPNVHCIKVQHNDVTIKNVEAFNCGNSGIFEEGRTGLTIKNNYLH